MVAKPVGKLKKVTGKLEKVSKVFQKVIVQKAEKGDMGSIGPQGLMGPQGPAGRDAPTTEEILSQLLESKKLDEILKRELYKLPAGFFGGAGRLDVQDLPGYKGASAGQVFGILDSGRAGFFDIGTVDVAEYTRLIDTDGSFKYVGEANPGTDTSTASWRIKRVEWTDGDDWEILWANGTSSFDKTWDDRASYSYS